MLGQVLAIELLAAAQALECRRPLRTSEALEAVVEKLRKVVPALTNDRPFAPGIEAANALVEELRASAQLRPGRIDRP